MSHIINYIYTANGNRTRYNGGFIYEGNTLKQIQHHEGYVDMSGGAVYHYYLKDHLGNNRMVVNQTGAVVQQTDYYPFGLAFNKAGSSDNKFLYNGKELQEDMIGNGLLDWYDYGARMYDPALGRFHTPDPLAEYRYNMTPYHYVMNNPMKFIDPNGLQEEEPEVIVHVSLPEVTVTAPAPSNNVSWLWSFFTYSQRGGYHLSDPNGNPNYSNPFTALHTEYVPNALRLISLIGGFGSAKGVNRGSRFNDGISKSVGKASEIGITSDPDIKRSATGERTVETDGSGQTKNIEIVKERKSDNEETYYIIATDTTITLDIGWPVNHDSITYSRLFYPGDTITSYNQRGNRRFNVKAGTSR